MPKRKVSKLEIKDKMDQPDYKFPPPHEPVWRTVNGHRRRYFEPGWVVGNYGCKFLKDAEYAQNDVKKSHRRADFICPLCGEIFNARIDQVIGGEIKSCGCRKKVSSAINAYNMTISGGHRHADITGERFGNLTALYPTDNRGPNSNIYWMCKCDCGNMFKATVMGLKSGHNKRCPDCRWKLEAEKDIGKRFGKLVVTKLVPNERTSNGGVICEAICDCGRTIKIGLGFLHRGQESCGKCKVSKGENKVQELLSTNGIYFTQQESFNGDMKIEGSTIPCRADFYLPNQKIVIEYNGQQHYEPCNFFGGEENFGKTIKRDEWKSRYYKEHNLKLIEIPYSDYEILDWEYLQKKGVTSEERFI